MTWFLVLSQGLQDIYSSKGQYSCRALLRSIWEEAQPNSFAKRPIIPTWHTLQVASVFYSTLRRAQSRCWNVYSTPRLFSLREPTALHCSLKHSPFFWIPQIRTCTIQKFRLRLGTHTPDSISQGSTRSGWLPRFQI